jgi:Protein of unknown function (DUF3050)
MGKSEVHSWRLSQETRAIVEDEARRQRTSLAGVLDRIVQEWRRRQERPDDDSAEQADILQRYLTKPWAPEKLQGMLDEAATLYLQDLDRFEIVSQTIAGLRNQLLSHRVYGMLTNMRALRTLTEYHCYSGWDFMALLKCLQNKLTCTEVPSKRQMVSSGNT